MRVQSLQKIFIYTIVFGIALAAIALFSSKQAFALDDFCTWTGAGGDSLYANANNWSGCDNSHTPESGDTLILPNGPTNKTVTFDSTTSARNLRITGDNYLVNSATLPDLLVVLNEIEISGNNNTLSALTYFISSSDTFLTVSGTSNAIENDVVLQPSAGGADFVINASGSIEIQNISNAGGTLIDTVIKSGEGIVTITGGSMVGSFDSNYGLDITAGTWRCDVDRCVGDDAKDVVIEEGGTSDAAVLQLNNASINIENNIYIASTSGDPAVIRATENATLSGDVSFMTSGVFEASSSKTLAVSGNVSLSSGQTMHANGSGTVVQSGIVSGAGNITVNGIAQLTNTNTYTGSTTINGVATISDALALGSSAGNTAISDNGQLIAVEDTTGYTLDEDITLQGDGPSNTGALIINNSHASDMTLTGAIIMSGNGVITNNSANGSVILDTVISGAGNVTLTGASSAVNDFIIDGASPNTYTGTMIVNQGFVRFDKDGSVPGNLTVTAHTSEYSGALHGSGITNAVSDTSTVTLTNNGTSVASLDIDGTETIGGLAGDGAIDESGDTLVLNGSGTYEFTGDITVDTITKSGSGTQIFNNIDAQTITVSGGNIIVKGTTTATMSLASGSVLKGTGPIGNTAVAGMLAPGLSPGIMTVNGNLNLTNGTYQAELNGTVAGTSYDQTVVSGTTTLSGTTLSLSLGFTPTIGNTFTILRSAVLSGTFNGLSDNATVSASGVNMRINYNLNSSGEDTVTLTVLSLPTAPSTGLAKISVLPAIITLVIGAILALAVAVRSCGKNRRGL